MVVVGTLVWANTHKSAPIIEASDKASLAFCFSIATTTSTNNTGRRDTFGEYKRHWSVEGAAKKKWSNQSKAVLLCCWGGEGVAVSDGLVCHGFRSVVSSALTFQSLIDHAFVHTLAS